MSTGSSPPAQPPMMSPDGKWVWNGQKWIPVAVHESVFHQYGEAVAAAQTDMPLAETMVSPPVNPFSPAVPVGAPASPFASPPSGFTSPATASAPAVVSPMISAPISYTTGDVVPPWQQWAAGGSSRSRNMYMVGALIAVILGVTMAIYFGLWELPFLRADNQGDANQTPAVTPTPLLTERTDSAVAGRFVTSVIIPGYTGLGQPFVNYTEACNGTLSFSCQQALDGMNSALKDAIGRFSQTAPTCIAAQAAKVKVDLTTMQAGVTLALKAYNDNNRNELLQGLGTFNAGNRPLQNDVEAVTKTQASCDDQAQGP